MTLPKVSCIMPCGYGDKYVEMALNCFFSQRYEGELQLVVLENNEQPLLQGLADVAFCTYMQTKRKPVGALRNEAISKATGEVLVIWDEDDWHSTDRVARQVERLIQSGKAVTGWHSLLYYDEATGGTYRYVCHPADAGRYAIGMSHCFYRTWWEKHPYVEVGVEDKIFSDEAMHRNQLDSCDAGQLYVGRIHSSNTVDKRQYLGKHKQWPSVPRSEFPKEFFDAISVGIEE
jgi:glycosyltransferase involved in cell wall biosynthesis